MANTTIMSDFASIFDPTYATMRSYSPPMSKSDRKPIQLMGTTKSMIALISADRTTFSRNRHKSEVRWTYNRLFDQICDV